MVLSHLLGLTRGTPDSFERKIQRLYSTYYVPRTVLSSHHGLSQLDGCYDSPQQAHTLSHSVFTDATASVAHPCTRGPCLRSCEQHVSSWPSSGVRGDQHPLPLLPAELLVLQLLNRLGGAIYRFSFILAGPWASRAGTQEFPGLWC